MRLPASAEPFEAAGAVEEMVMQLAECKECEKVWLTPVTEADERRECADCGSLLTAIEDAQQPEIATPSRADG